MESHRFGPKAGSFRYFINGLDKELEISHQNLQME